MKTQGWILLTLALGVALSGCGGPQPAAQKGGKEGVTSVTATETGESPASAEDVIPENLPIAASASPGEVVTFFLDSLRAGHKSYVAATLTKKARIETTREGLVVQPIGAPDAKYEVGAIDYVGIRKDGAHVQSIWSETDENGSTVSYEVIWVLRKQETGWRIAGMAIPMGDGEPPEFLNFENPKEVSRKLHENSQHTASSEEAATPPSEPPVRSR